MAKKLNLSEASNLYLCLKNHIPKDINDLDPIDFMGKILESIKKTPDKLLQAFRALSGLQDREISDLLDEDASKAYLMFLEGLMENKIMSLIRFMEGLHE